MATISSYTTGDWSNTATWSGSVVPVVGDRVNILAGHTVTVDGTYTAGDDTANGITITGTLKASRSVSSSLTVRGDLLVSSGGTLDYGTEADPIPLGVTAEIYLNDSASQSHNKWGLRTDSASTTWAGVRIWGQHKVGRASMTATALAGDTTFTFDDVTGWEVGDVLIFGPCLASNGPNGCVVRAITGISGNNVTVGASLGYASEVGRIAANFTRNVKIRGKNGNTYRTHVSVDVASSFSTVDAIEIGPCDIATGGATSPAQYMGGLSLYWRGTGNTTDAVKRIYAPCVHGIWGVSGSTVTTIGGSVGGSAALMCFTNRAYAYTIEDPVLSAPQGGATVGYGAYIGNGSSTNLSNPTILRAEYGVQSSWGEGAIFSVIAGGVITGVTYAVGYTATAITLDGVSIDGCTYVVQDTALANLRLTDCTIGALLPVTSRGKAGGAGTYGNSLIENCVITSFPMPRASLGLNLINAGSRMFLRNRNNDPTSQAIYRKGGLIERDNSVTRRSRSTLRLDCWHSGIEQFHEFTVKVAASGEINLVGAARFNTTYGTAAPPEITISGLGITPVTWTATATADTWHEFDLTATNPNAYPGEFTVRMSGWSAADTDTASCWFDGVPMPDFVDWTHQYGYAYDPSASAREPDPIVVLSETAAGALSGISFSSGTLTISGALSISEVYDWMKWYETQNLLEPLMTSADGVAFALNADLTLSGTLTGTGTLTIGASTFSGSGQSSIPITHGAGVYTTIAVSGYTIGARIQLYDVTSSAELYNDIPAGASLAVNSAWTTNHTIRCRMARVSGTDADGLIETQTLLTAAGATFLLSPEPDAIYEANAIDGSTVTEFTADYPNVQIDVSDPDGVTTPQRGYAWYMAGQMTADGIAAYHGAMIAEDAYNYRIETAVADMKVQNVSTSACVIAGARLYRSDGDSIFEPGAGPIQHDPDKAYTASTDPASIAAYPIEAGLTVEQVLRILLAHAAGSATGLDGAAIFKSQDGATNRIVGTISGGTRTISSVDGS